MTSTELAAWLRQQREERGWTRAEMARQLIQAGQARGDRHVPGLHNMAHNVYRWERAADGVSERYKLHYCQAFGIKPSQFGPAPEAAIEPAAPDVADGPDSPELVAGQLMPYVARVPAAPGLPSSRIVAYRGIEESGMADSMVKREVLMAAHDGSEHAEQADSPGIGEATMEQLRADLVRLSRQSDTGEPLAVFLDMRRVRARVYRLLDQRLWPREQNDLYFFLGCLNGLMGVTANRLGYPDAAEELIRAGWAYATAIDHRPLLGQLRRELSTIILSPTNSPPRTTALISRTGDFSPRTGGSTLRHSRRLDAEVDNTDGWTLEIVSGYAFLLCPYRAKGQPGCWVGQS
jgi:transcriptional regulator with XRE-family HTH domain